MLVINSGSNNNKKYSIVSVLGDIITSGGIAFIVTRGFPKIAFLLSRRRAIPNSSREAVAVEEGDEVEGTSVDDCEDGGAADDEEDEGKDEEDTELPIAPPPFDHPALLPFELDAACRPSRNSFFEPSARLLQSSHSSLVTLTGRMQENIQCGREMTWPTRSHGPDV